MEALPGFRDASIQVGSTTQCPQSCILAKGSQCGNSGQNVHSKDRVAGGETSMPRPAPGSTSCHVLSNTSSNAGLDPMVGQPGSLNCLPPNLVTEGAAPLRVRASWLIPTARVPLQRPLVINPRGRVLAAAAKSLQSCLTLCDPIDGSSPGSPVPGILQARTLDWIAVSFSNS